MKNIKGLAVGALAAAGLLFTAHPALSAETGASATVGAGAETKSDAQSADTTKSASNQHAKHHHRHHRKSPQGETSKSEGKANASGGLKTPAGDVGADGGVGVDAETPK